MMNSKARVFVKNVSYTLTANITSLIISTLIVIIIPKLIGVEDYGYWQLYLFYASYVGFLQFGWNDGIYLRYGGNEYKNLDKRLFFSQFWMLTISQVILAAIISLLSVIFINEKEKLFILIMVALCTIIMGVRAMPLFILQATNRIKEYAVITMIDRILYCCLIIIFLVFGIREYKLMIVADLIGKFISLGYALYCCGDIVFLRISKFQFSFREVIENINVGIKLMLANIASMFIIGIVRFGIEQKWNVSTFGKVSLTLSISNLMMIFINALGIIIFPILKRTDNKRLSGIYLTMRDFLMIILLGTLIVYYPLNVILVAWLPVYADSLKYMVLLLPMCVYEGKMALLINTYLKTLRKEKLMLMINLLAVMVSLIFTFITTFILKNLDLAVLSIVFLLAFRCVLAELILSKNLAFSVYKDIGLELILTIIFIISGWFFNPWLALLIYILVFCIYLTIKRKDVVVTIKNLKLLLKA